LREIVRAVNCGIKKVIVSAIFPSKSPSANKVKGQIKLARMIRQFPKQNFYALGGINRKSLKRLKGINLKGIAGVSFD
jgi:thiamine monophosphate synthase